MKMSIPSTRKSKSEVGDQKSEVRGRRSEVGKSENRRSEEHTSELQSPCNLVCRLLLEKKKHLLSLILGSVMVLILPLLLWLTPDLKTKKSLLQCYSSISTAFPRSTTVIKIILLRYRLL